MKGKYHGVIDPIRFASMIALLTTAQAAIEIPQQPPPTSHQETSVSTPTQTTRTKAIGEKGKQATAKHRVTLTKTIPAVSDNTAPLAISHDMKQVSSALKVGAIKPAVVVSIKNGDTLTLPLSNHETNRLLVANDKLAGVVCPPMACHATVSRIDPSDSAYITLSPMTTKPFMLHISTLAHRYFSFRVIPDKKAGQTVLIEPQSPGKVSVTLPTDAAWSNQLIQLVVNMEQNQLPDGYGSMTYPTSKPYRMQSGINAKKILTWQGETMQITRYRLTNHTHHPIALTEAEFYQPGVLAVALSESSLLPRGAVTLYEVNRTHFGGQQ